MNWLVGTYSKRNSEGIYLINLDEDSGQMSQIGSFGNLTPKNPSFLVIGDNIKTDILGANNMKFDSLLVTKGIHKKDFLNMSVKNYDKVLNKYGVKTNYYQERLIW